MTHHADEDASTLPRHSAILVAFAYVTPSALGTLALPQPWRLVALGLLALLALLLLAAAAWSRAAATEKGLDPTTWAHATILTMGLAMLPLLLARPRHGPHEYACLECGARAAIVEAFCYKCGAA